MAPKASEPSGYVARFGFDAGTMLVLATCVVFVALMVWLPTDPAWLWAIKVAGLLLFGVGGAFFAFVAARGGVALAVDDRGITLGNPNIPQPGMTNRPVHFAWDDVTDAVLFDQYHAGGRTHYVGVRVRPGAQATAMTFNTSSRLWNTNRKLMAHVPEDVLMRSRPVTGWRLDVRQLCEAVAMYAPDVQVIQLDRAGNPQPVDAA